MLPKKPSTSKPTPTSSHNCKEKEKSLDSVAKSSPKNTTPKAAESIDKLNKLKLNEHENGKHESDSDSDSSSDDEQPVKIKAPNELLEEFLFHVIAKHWQEAYKLCQFILMYEPDNQTANQYLPLLKENIEMSNDSDETSDDDDDDEDDEDDDDESDDDDEDEDSSSEEDDDDDDDDVEIPMTSRSQK